VARASRCSFASTKRPVREAASPRLSASAAASLLGQESAGHVHSAEQPCASPRHEHCDNTVQHVSPAAQLQLGAAAAAAGAGAPAAGAGAAAAAPMSPLPSDSARDRLPLWRRDESPLSLTPPPLLASAAAAAAAVSSSISGEALASAVELSPLERLLRSPRPRPL
jgi:hypothetical protein